MSLCHVCHQWVSVCACIDVHPRPAAEMGWPQEVLHRIGEVLSQVRYRDSWRLRVHSDSPIGRVYLQWFIDTMDVVTGKRVLQHCRKWYLSPHMTESELVQTAFLAAKTAEEHECREMFTYLGRRVFGPHISVRELMAVCDREERRA